MRMTLLGALLAIGAAAGLARAECGGTDLLAGDAEPGLAAALAERTAGVANGEGRFWKIDRWGVAPSYILGTFHDTEAAEVAVTPEMHAALAAADRLIVEMSPDEQERMMLRMATDPGFAFDLAGEPLDARISPDLVPQLREMLADRGLSLETVRFMRPWLIFSVLGISRCQQQAMAAGDPVMDQALIDAAEGAGIPVIGLETHEAVVEAFARLSGDDLTALLDDTLRNFVMLDEEDLRRTTMNLYLAGRTYAIWEFSTLLSERHGSGSEIQRRASLVMWEDVMIARNRNWSERLIEEVARGNSFIAVGALHLPSEDGLVAIFRNAGYSVERLD